MYNKLKKIGLIGLLISILCNSACLDPIEIPQRLLVRSPYKIAADHYEVGSECIDLLHGLLEGSHVVIVSTHPELGVTDLNEREFLRSLHFR